MIETYFCAWFPACHDMTSSQCNATALHSNAEVLTAVIQQLQHQKPVIRKKAATCLGALAATSSDGLLHRIVANLLDQVLRAGSPVCCGNTLTHRCFSIRSNLVADLDLVRSQWLWELSPAAWAAAWADILLESCRCSCSAAATRLLRRRRSTATLPTRCARAAFPVSFQALCLHPFCPTFLSILRSCRGFIILPRAGVSSSALSARGGRLPASDSAHRGGVH